MKLRKIVGGAAVLFVGLILFSMFRYGWFHSVEVVDETIPAMTIIATSHTGPYQNVGPVMGKLYDDVKAAGVSGVKGVGIYFDNPENVASEKLRALVGQEIAVKDLAKIGKIASKYTIIEMPSITAKVVHFPYRGQLSIIFAVTKAYPALKAACGDSITSAAIEMYDLPNKEILFVIPQNISRDVQESWLAPNTVPKDTVSTDTISVKDSI